MHRCARFSTNTVHEDRLRAAGTARHRGDFSITSTWRSPRGAHRVSLAIEYAIEMCALNPYASEKTDEPDVYRRPLGGKYPYTIFYRAPAHGQGIEVARVVHGARVKNSTKNTRRCGVTNVL